MLPLLSRLTDPPPRVALGAFPSPLEGHPDLGRRLGATSLLVKREDLNGAEFGGNKLRALEFLLPTAGPAVVSMGGYGSTWCAALARTAAALGASVHVALFPQPWNETVAGVLQATAEDGQVHLAGSRLTMPAALLRAWLAAAQHGAPRWIPAGGATPRAILGGINALLELGPQLEAAGEPPPSAIVVPLGTGGTAAGLLLGSWLCRWDTEICAVRVTDPWYANRRRVMALVGRTRRLLHRHGLRVSPGPARLRVIGDQLGKGYGHSTPAARSAAEHFAVAGIRLDTTYGAKAAAALSALAPAFTRLCFWHTFDSRLVSTRPLEHPILRAARAHAESLWPLQKST